MAASLRVSAAHSSTSIADLAILGPEDVAVGRTADVAYVSSQDRRAAEWLAWGMLRGRATDLNQRGCIYKLKLNSPRPMPFQMADNLPAEEGFHPAGLDLHVSKDGRRRRLFVAKLEPIPPAGYRPDDLRHDARRLVAALPASGSDHAEARRPARFNLRVGAGTIPNNEGRMRCTPVRATSSMPDEVREDHR